MSRKQPLLIRACPEFRGRWGTDQAAFASLTGGHSGFHRSEPALLTLRLFEGITSLLQFQTSAGVLSFVLRSGVGYRVDVRADDAGDGCRTRTDCCVRAVVRGMPALDSSVPVGMTVMMLMLVFRGQA